MKPNIFVSSTCFDLSQVRTDIEETIIGLGFHPILSDRNNFPVNPSEELIDNCVNTVSNSADILILIIGSRYGSKSETGKSITNIEYDTARRLGIPIFVFIKKEILNYLEVWKANKEGDFSKQVDTTEVFEFVSKIREEDKIWSFEFADSQDISKTFISQMAFKFKELLDINKQLTEGKLHSIWEYISPKAKKILIRKDTAYEIDYFRQVLTDELSKIEKTKIHYDYNILSTCTDRIEDNVELYAWFQKQLKSLNNFVDTFNILINQLFPKYYGEPGVPSDVKGFLLIAQSYSKLMSEMLEWSLAVKNISVPEKYENLVDTFSRYLDETIKTSWDFPNVLESNIKSGLERLSRGEEGIVIEIVLELKINQEISSKFVNEIHRVLAIA